MRIRAALRAIVAVAVTTVALVAPSQVADAAPATVAQPTLKPTQSVVLHKIATKTSATNAAAPPVITCNASSDYPHNSNHVPGTINVVGRGVCDYAVGEIDVVVGLFRGNTIVGTPGARVQTNVASLSANSSAPCVAGTYIGVADVIFTAPPGYEPAWIRLAGQSIPVPLTC